MLSDRHDILVWVRCGVSHSMLVTVLRFGESLVGDPVESDSESMAEVGSEGALFLNMSETRD